MSDTTQREVRVKFWELARRQFPAVGEPGTVWVLSEVLGWDWDQINRTAVEGFSKDGYRLFLLDDNGDRIFNHEKGEVTKVYRKWTKAERSKLKDWWWLLGYEY